MLLVILSVENVILHEPSANYLKKCGKLALSET